MYYSLKVVDFIFIFKTIDAILDNSCIYFLLAPVNSLYACVCWCSLLMCFFKRLLVNVLIVNCSGFKLMFYICRKWLLGITEYGIVR